MGEGDGTQVSGVRLQVFATERGPLLLKRDLEEAGLVVHFDGPTPIESRGVGEAVGAWFALWVTEKAIEATPVGQAADRAVRGIVDRVVASFRDRYPNLRISVDRPSDDEQPT